MRFLLDHDVPAEVARVLSREGRETACVAAVMSARASDEEVLEYSIRNGYVLVSCNRDDFLALTESRAHAGLIILIRRRTRVAECAALLKLIRAAGENGIIANVNFA